MNRPLIFLILCPLVLLLTTYQLPAPISEASGSPTPAREQSAKPKIASENSQSQTKRNAFDGTWVGTINQGSLGYIQLTQAISGSGTVVRSTSKLGAYTWNATCDGKTMQWSVKTKHGSGVRTFTPNRDGKTALMTFESGAFHSSATFYKASP